MTISAPDRILVCNADGAIVERVDAGTPRFTCLASAANATVVRKRHRGPVVRILLADAGDCSMDDPDLAKPAKTSHDHATEKNPPNVWMLKRIRRSTAELYCAVLAALVVDYRETFMQPTKLPPYTITPQQLATMQTELAANQFTLTPTGANAFHFSGPHGIVGDATYDAPSSVLQITITKEGFLVTTGAIESAIQKALATA
jgi:hypothetical protein